MRNKPKYIERAKKYREDNREDVLSKKRLYYKTPSGKATSFRSTRHQREKHPERSSLYARVAYAIKLGIITKSKFCELCDKEKPLQGHHYDYKKEFDLVWVCLTCHKAIHTHKIPKSYFIAKRINKEKS